MGQLQSNLQKLNKSNKTETFGKIPREELEIDKERWNEELGRAIMLKSNAEKTLKWLMEKFKFTYTEQKRMIQEIEYNDKKIKELEKLLKDCETYLKI